MPIGLRTDQANGSGYLPPGGRGSQANRGAGLLITTADGHTCRDSDGPGYRASARVIAGTATGITTGAPRLFISSIVQLLVATTSDGTRSRRGNAGADLTIGEEVTARTGLREMAGENRTMADLVFALLHCITG